MRDHNLTKQNLDKDDLLSKKSDTDSNIPNSSYLQSQLLIAMPGLEDPYFKQSVTLICQHNEDGCFGITINKPTDTNVFEVLNQLTADTGNQSDSKELEKDSITTERNKAMSVLRGGPVKMDQGFVIHNGTKEWENTILINEDLSVTLSKDILSDIVEGNGPEKYLFTLGCASWIEGQIEDEVINNSWLNCSVDNDLIFEMPYEKRWQGAADILGVNMNTLSMISGHA